MKTVKKKHDDDIDDDVCAYLAAVTTIVDINCTDLNCCRAVNIL